MFKCCPTSNLSLDGSAEELVASSVTIVWSSSLELVAFCLSPSVLVFLAGGGPPCPSDSGSDGDSCFFLCSKNEVMSAPPSLCCGRGELGNYMHRYQITQCR